MNIKKFIVYTGAGGGIWAGILIGVGYLIGDNKQLVRHYMPYVEGFVIGGVITMIVYYVKRHRKQQKTEVSNGSL